MWEDSGYEPGHHNITRRAKALSGGKASDIDSMHAELLKGDVTITSKELEKLF